MSKPAIGSAAPAFAGVTQDGSAVSLENLKGRRVALYFYPRDNTSGCTTQACNLRDHFGALADAGVTIIGVSEDPVESHRKFADKFELPFPLIADTDHSVHDAYGTWIEKSMYGRKYMGTQRCTFLIDEKGILHGMIEKPKVGNHAAEILEGFGLRPGR